MQVRPVWNLPPNVCLHRPLGCTQPCVLLQDCLLACEDILKVLQECKDVKLVSQQLKKVSLDALSVY